MNEKEIQVLAGELAKSLKTPENSNQLCTVLKKVSIEAALGAELSDHLGYGYGYGYGYVNGSARTGSNSHNTIESLNSVIRHVTNKRKIFPSDDSARKIIYSHSDECIKEVDDAYSKLARSYELVYDQV